MLMRHMLFRLQQANEATDASLAKLQATNARIQAFDELAYRAYVRAESEANKDLDWVGAAAFLGLGGGVDPAAGISST